MCEQRYTEREREREREDDLIEKTITIISGLLEMIEMGANNNCS